MIHMCGCSIRVTALLAGLYLYVSTHRSRGMVVFYSKTAADRYKCIYHALHTLTKMNSSLEALLREFAETKNKQLKRYICL